MGGTGSVRKQFNVVDVSKTKKHLLLYESYESFKRKCKSKFNISEDSNVFFVLEEDEDTEVDCGILEKVTPEKSVLIIKVEGQNDKETAQNKTDDQPNIFKESKGDHTVKRIQHDQRETQKQHDRKEDRPEQSKNSAPNAEKSKEDQLPEKETVDSDEVYEGASNNKEWKETEEGTEVKEHMDKYGFDNIGGVLQRSLNKWSEIPLHIAVTGASGKGKSSFINAFRGLQDGDPGTAEVDVKECTRTLTPYTHPKYENFVLWDVPGVGTSNFPKESYLETINVERYEFFFVVTTERFTETDSWLIKEVKLRSKPCYVIRTKIDNDLRSVSRKERGDFDEMRVFNRLKKEFELEIRDSVDIDTKFDFFVISNYFPMKYDFPGLQEQVLKDVPPAKKNAMVFGVAALSSNVVKAKADALRSRIWKVAVMSGTGAVIPVPFFSTGLNAALILGEVNFYQSQFGIDDNSLEKLAALCGVTLANLKEEIEFKTPTLLLSTAGIVQFLGKSIEDEITEKSVRLIVPIIGSAISCSISYKSTATALTALLETMEYDALKVLEYVAKKTCNVL